MLPLSRLLGFVADRSETRSWLAQSDQQISAILSSVYWPPGAPNEALLDRLALLLTDHPLHWFSHSLASTPEAVADCIAGKYS